MLVKPSRRDPVSASSPRSTSASPSLPAARRSLRLAIVLSSAGWLAACAPLPATSQAGAAPDNPPACDAAGTHPAWQAELMFGRDIAGRGPVTDAERSAFVAEIVTPRFPDGLTQWDTQGHWRDRETGAIVREASFVIRLVAPPTSTTRQALDDVRDAYKQRFRQQSVGLLVTDICAAF
ncbi:MULTISPECIES: DUF3574 domain-containing protein [unclassified Burkholderia]|uniref:DUF3574 domain-containing protein n=1 Tax=unclassified Burkholderia TaxID=2613784 RepID=UPI001DCCF036|nr:MULTISPECIES: DUF3574 domain-containing protein [unclassified Burkholderia]NIE83162.1 DUF3574 domain-containing protein [Burkholderia sp. Tr-860]NIF62093.1 DUF3574 domain-containing protein [Burkholderia sp. Cy-647]NIF86826.1 DUF3574 domain-containing protein [Burkholderia sp. Cy-637]NIF94079.1 DUF3574 domain-containing protein [Burkholderia sp. Ax-1720]